MSIKILNAVIAIIGGIGGAIIIFWILNKLAESLKGRWEDRVKPWMFAGPAILAIAVYLIYPAVVTVQYSFANADTTAYVGFQNYIDLFTDDGFLSVLFNNVLWILVVPAMTVVLGLGVAVLADRLRPQGEKTTKTFIFLPMAISFVGAATIWRTVYDYQPEGAAPDRHAQRGPGLLRQGPGVLVRREHPALQQPAADDHPDLDRGRVRHGAAVVRDQERAGGHRRGRPASTAPASDGSSSTSSFRRSGRP